MAPSTASRKLVGQPLLYAISIFASLGVFLFGYDQGVMSGIITGPHFIEYFHSPGSVKLGTMVAVLEVGNFSNDALTSLAAGRVGDIIGRKGTLFIGALVFTLGGAIQTFTFSFGMMVLGRIVSGFGVGLLSTIVPIYQSEVSPPNHRGALACAEFTGNIFGYAFSVWTDYFCSFIESNNSWRIPLFVQCIIGAILAAGSLFMPESPRWLIDTDKDEEGMRVLVDLHGGDPHDPVAKAEFREIKDKVLMERNSGEGRSYAMMWRRYKRRILLAMSSQAKNGTLVDRWGRRPILLSGAAVMGLSLCATGWFMYLDIEQTPGAVVVCVIIFNAAFGYSWGPVPWLYPPEILPLTIRAKGVSLSTVYPETKGVPLEEMDAVRGAGPKAASYERIEGEEEELERLHQDRDEGEEYEVLEREGEEREPE
ncbi:hypothetical protein C8R44DRAFT_829310 [Mycena epipterygia]|nr:hypothetical protein C8R44DRAFT_829310 [Mycena epipterygia]